MHIEDSAEVAPSSSVGEGARIWHHAQIREDATIGSETIVGRGAYIGSGVRVGSRCKIQNYALVYEPATLHDGVFIGPAAVLTNDLYPRAVDPTGALKAATDWEPVGVTVHYGASVGARAVCVAPITIGRWAMVAAGSVVTKDVGDFALVVGVPARQVGWVGSAGVPLVKVDEDCWRCPVSSRLYRETDGVLKETEGHA